MKSFFAEFKKFALRGNAVDLAVGVVIGASFNAITNSLVNNILTPPLSLLTKGINFNELKFNIPNTTAAIQYGVFIQTVINFIITAFALFLLVKFINRLERIAQEKREAGEEAPDQPAKSAELATLEEIRDLLKSRAPEASR